MQSTSHEERTSQESSRRDLDLGNSTAGSATSQRAHRSMFSVDQSEIQDFCRSMRQKICPGLRSTSRHWRSETARRCPAMPHPWNGALQPTTFGLVSGQLVDLYPLNPRSVRAQRSGLLEVLPAERRGLNRLLGAFFGGSRHRRLTDQPAAYTAVRCCAGDEALEVRAYTGHRGRLLERTCTRDPESIRASADSRFLACASWLPVACGCRARPGS